MSIKDKARGLPVIVLALAVIGATAGCSLIPKEEEPLQPPLVKPVKENYEIAEVKRGPVVKKVSGVATIESTNTKSHEFPGGGGRVQEVRVRAGDKVQAGDILMVLEAGDSGITLKERERDLEQAKFNLDNAKQTQDPQKMKIRLMELEIAQMKLEEAAKAVEGKTLKAQISGVVTFVDNVKPGDTVQTDKTYVLVSDPKSVRLSFTSGNSTELQEVQVGMKAEVNFRGAKLEGKVVQTPGSAPATDNKALAERYAKTVYLELLNTPADMELNSSADFSIITKQKDDVIVVPPRAVNQFIGRSYVKVQEGNGIREIDVEKGIETPNGVEIVKGLKEGQKLILP